MKYQKSIYELQNELPNDLRLRTLWNAQMKLSKCNLDIYKYPNGKPDIKFFPKQQQLTCKYLNRSLNTVLLPVFLHI